jgi:hypothetical protein
MRPLRTAVLSLILSAASLEAGGFVQADFQAVTSSESFFSPFDLKISFPSEETREGAYSFAYDLRNLEFRSSDERENYSYTLLGDLIASLWPSDDIDSLRRVMPREGLLGREIVIEGHRLESAGCWQVKILFPPSVNSEYSFKIRSAEVIHPDAGGWCYLNGESAFTDRPKGSFVDESDSMERGAEKTYLVYVDHESNLVLSAEDYRMFGRQFYEW